MQNLQAYTLIASLVWLGFTTAQNTTTNYFVNPPIQGVSGDYTGNNVYTQGSSINFEWRTNYPTLSLTLIQDGNESNILLLEEVPTQSSYVWYVDLSGLFNLTHGNGKTQTELC
jgi:hypothetical protein